MALWLYYLYTTIVYGYQHAASWPVQAPNASKAVDYAHEPWLLAQLPERMLPPCLQQLPPTKPPGQVEMMLCAASEAFLALPR